MHDAAPGGQPLHVALAVPSGGAKGIGVIDITPTDHGHRFEPSVRVLGEAGHDIAVVHAPPVEIGEVDSDVASAE